MAERSSDDAMEEVRGAMDETRARLADTAEQLGDALGERTAGAREKVEAVKERLDVGALVQRHPWPALGLAVGLGVALAASGADRRAASATASTARRATRATRETVQRRRDHARLRQQLAEDEPRVSRGGLVDRLTRGIIEAIDLDGLVASLRDAGAHMAHRAPDVDVTRNRMAQRGDWGETL